MYNYKIGKQLDDILTRCSSHPKGDDVCIVSKLFSNLKVVYRESSISLCTLISSHHQILQESEDPEAMTKFLIGLAQSSSLAASSFILPTTGYVSVVLDYEITIHNSFGCRY